MMLSLLIAAAILVYVLLLAVLSRANGPDLPPPECSDEEARKILTAYGVRGSKRH